MPRNGSGTYSLPAGNPVVSGTTIQASWANSTLADISTELTGSLARNGAGGMLGALRGVDGTVSVPAFSFTSETTSGFYRAGTGDVRFAMAGADVYTVTSTGVGIGTSSPGAKLEVASGKVLLSNTQSYAIKTSAGSSCDVVTLTSGNVLQLGGGGATDSIQFWNQGLQRMTLDSSGNLGLGVTPSAWSGVVAMQFPTGAAFSGFSNTTNTVQNAYYNGGWKYVSTAAAALFQVAQGVHYWYTAPSGTAGNAISFTQAMTLDASGNLGVGTTSPGARLETVAAGSAIYFSGGDSAGARRLQFSATTTTNTGDTQNINALGSTGVLAFSTNSSERARITSGGDLLVGKTATTNGEKFGVRGSGATSVPTNLSDLNGALALVDCSIGNTAYGAFGFQSAGGGGAAVVLGRGTAYDTNILFCTNPSTTTTSGAMTERARITSAGDLLVGTTTLAGAGGVSFQSQGGTGFAVINNNNAGATGYVFSSYRRSSVEIGSITQNGTTAVLFNTTSDRRLKNNIVPAPSASAVIDAIEIVSHDWKAAPGEHVTYGVIAQDLHAVVPQAVLQGDDGDEIEKTWGVDYSKLVPMLIKEIQSLRARVAALEAA